MTSDEDLMLQVAGGDMDAFEELVRRHQQSSLNVAYRFLSDRTRAEDVVQDAFLKVLAAGPRYRPTAKFRTYLFNVIWHLCVDQYRRKRPDRLESEGLVVDAGPGPDGRVADAEQAARVREAVDALPPRQRMALVLKHFEGMSYEDIGRALDCSPRAVDALLVRAKRKLKEKLTGLL